MNPRVVNSRIERGRHDGRLHAVGNPIGVREPQVPLEMPRVNTTREQARRVRQMAGLERDKDGRLVARRPNTPQGSA